jgi:signal peptidase II
MTQQRVPSQPEILPCKMLFKWPLQLQLIFLSTGFTAIDQMGKCLAKSGLMQNHPVSIFPGIFQLSLTYNTGAAFSLMKQQPQLLLLLSASLFTVLLLYAFIQPAAGMWQRLGMSMILGGALGNLIDRIQYGAVVDFLDFVVIHYPIFNLADCFIFCGALMLCWIQLRMYYRLQ